MFIRDATSIFGTDQVYDVSEFLHLPPKSAFLANFLIFLRTNADQREYVVARIRRWEERFPQPVPEAPPIGYEVKISVFAVPPTTPFDPSAIERDGRVWYHQTLCAVRNTEAKSSIQLADNPARFASEATAKLKDLGNAGGVSAEVKVRLRDARLADPAGAKLAYAGPLLNGIPAAVRFDGSSYLVALLEAGPQPWRVKDTEEDGQKSREAIWRARGPSLEFLKPPLKEKLKQTILPQVDFQEVPLREIVARLLKDREIEIDLSQLSQLSQLSDSARDTPITLRLDRIPIDELLRYVTALGRVSFRIDGEIVRLVPLGTGREEPMEVQVFQLYQGFADPPDHTHSLSGDPFANLDSTPVPPAPRPEALKLLMFREALGPGKIYDASSRLKRDFGVKFPPGAWAILNDAHGFLFVRNTQEQLDLVEAIASSCCWCGTWGNSYIATLLTDGDRLLHLGRQSAPSGQLAKSSCRGQGLQSKERFTIELNSTIGPDGWTADSRFQISATASTASGLLELDLTWAAIHPASSEGRIAFFEDQQSDLELHLRSDHEEDLGLGPEPELDPTLDWAEIGQQIADELAGHPSSESLSIAEIQAHNYRISASRMASFALEATENNPLLDQIAWLESAIPKVQAVSRHWYDVSEIFRSSGFPVHTAFWDRRSRCLVVRGASAELAALDRELPPINTSEEPSIAVDTLLVSAVGDSALPVLRPGSSAPMVTALTRGDWGEVKILGNVSVRTKPGIEVDGQVENPASINSLRIVTTPMMDPNGYDLVLDSHITAEIGQGVNLEQSSVARLNAERPLVLELGGRGTEDAPLYLLIIWARVE